MSINYPCIIYQLSIRALRLALRKHYVMHGSQLYIIGPNRVKYFVMMSGYDSNICKYFWEVLKSMRRDYDTSYFESRLFARADLTRARNWPEFVTLVCSMKQLESASMDQSTKLAVVYTALDWLSVQTPQIGLRVSLEWGWGQGAMTLTCFMFLFWKIILHKFAYFNQILLRDVSGRDGIHLHVSWQQSVIYL